MAEDRFDARDNEKRAAARAAATLVRSGMTVGLGTGSTVAHLLPALAELGLDIRCVATSNRTEREALRHGLAVEAFATIDRLDIAIDGADQIDPLGWFVKGGGGAHTREKIVAASADRFVVIADSSKVVASLHGPVPVELLAYGLWSTLRRAERIRLRDAPASPDGGVIGDYDPEDLSDPAAVATSLAAIAGLVDHGLFSPAMVHDVLIAHGSTVEHRRLR